MPQEQTTLDERSETLLDELYAAVFEGDRDAVVTVVHELIDRSVAPDVVLYDGMIPSIQEVGKMFEQGKAFVPEMLVAARAMQGGLDLLRPLMVQNDVQPLARAVIGTVKADIHDIGKNMVAMMWEGAGFEVMDLGVNVPPQKFIDAIQSSGATLVGISALLTTTMTNISVTLQAFKDAGLRDQVKVVIGGAPITAEFAAGIGADGYARDANQAVSVAKTLLGIA